MVADSIKPIIQAVLQYLAIRIRSRQEMAQYIERKTSDPDSIAAVMAYIDNHHLVNDVEFAKVWTESRLRRGKGDYIIREELRQKGISKEIIESTLAETEPELWYQSLEETVIKYKTKLSGLEGFKLKMKLKQILYARGFSARHIDAYLSRRLE